MGETGYRDCKRVHFFECYRPQRGNFPGNLYPTPEKNHALIGVLRQMVVYVLKHQKMKMKTSRFLLNSLLFAFMITFLNSCLTNEDPGPLQESEQEYSILDFNRLEMGDALNVTVEQGSIFSVKARGDRRNLDDLEVKKLGNTLRMRFVNDNHKDRQYTTYVTITMPAIEGALFSGAVTSKITGFTSGGKFDMTLSGASKSQVSINADALDLDLSGASEMNVSGTSSSLEATVSGASELRGYDLETETATVVASGASRIRILVTKQLVASASGASDIRYRGTPTLNTTTSGASSIGQD
jgi:hypothetical protein